MNDKTEKIINIAKGAGDIILQYYSMQEKNTNFKTEKEDGTPLTIADLKAHEFIIDRLTEETPGIPILSEEGQEIPYSQRKHWNKFWLIDPLDGTKEFLNCNGEFTVNIALIENNKPTFGIIHIPAQQTTYYGNKQGSFKIDSTGNRSQLKRKTRKSNQNSIRIVGSRSHSNEKLLQFTEKLKKTYAEVLLQSVGSSIKFCLVAEQIVDQYPRFTPTMEWDTAAGHAIINSCGYQILSVIDNQELTYNKKSLLNDEFIVS